MTVASRKFFQIVRDSDSDGEWHIAFFDEQKESIETALRLVSSTSRRAHVLVYACMTGKDQSRTIVWRAKGTLRLAPGFEP